MSHQPPGHLRPTTWQPGPRPAVPGPPVEVRVRVCPECAGPLVRAGGCLHCAHCGWGRCD